MRSTHNTFAIDWSIAIDVLSTPVLDHIYVFVLHWLAVEEKRRTTLSELIGGVSSRQLNNCSNMFIIVAVHYTICIHAVYCCYC